MKIETAKKMHLDGIVQVVHEAIVQLCTADHHGQKSLIDTWLDARSRHDLDRLLCDGQSRTFVCIEDSTILGVSHIDKSGELVLCYVRPQYTRRGLGQRLLQAAEQQAMKWGLSKVFMTSTATARDFYMHQGYIDTGESAPCFGMPGYALVKYLQKPLV